MDKTITVTGNGSVRVAPDLVVLRLDLQHQNTNYDTAVQAVGTAQQKLASALQQAGFAAADIKTQDLQIRTEYEYRNDPATGAQQRVFAGYVCQLALVVRFTLQEEKLQAALAAVAGSGADAGLSIEFSVQNPHAVKTELLRSAAQNARAVAEALTAATGAQLGELLHIEYNWQSDVPRSPTRYSDTLMAVGARSLPTPQNPDDISLSDAATFVWALA